MFLDALHQFKQQIVHLILGEIDLDFRHKTDMKDAKRIQFLLTKNQRMDYNDGRIATFAK